MEGELDMVGGSVLTRSFGWIERLVTRPCEVCWEFPLPPGRSGCLDVRVLPWTPSLVLRMLMPELDCPIL